MGKRAIKALAGGLLLAATMGLVGCSGTGGAGGSTAGGATPALSPTATATASAQPGCAQALPGATAFTGLAAVSGLSLPAGSYISSGSQHGGGAGQYQIATYTVCFPGSESAIAGSSGSTLGKLEQAGWTPNNLFPDPSNYAYLDYCSNSHNCVNSTGSPDPFTFVGFDQYASLTGGLTTFRLQVATIAAPTCLNDPQYYAGTPKYTLYYDGSSASSSGQPQNHFQMPPGTRVSAFLGGGTAGSLYVYFCSAGTQASVVNFLVQAMSNVGWTISSAASAGFTATYGSGPTYQIAVEVQSPNNYYLRVFVPM